MKEALAATFIKGRVLCSNKSAQKLHYKYFHIFVWLCNLWVAFHRQLLIGLLLNLGPGQDHSSITKSGAWGRASGKLVKTGM